MSDRQLTGLIGGRYEITGLIASGGMGSVYRATDSVLERVVALKVLREGGDDPAFTASFRTEATNAARLSHPGIVQVYDFGYADGMAYMAMEYVDGQTLRDVLSSKGVLRPEQATRIAGDVAAALEHARRAGIVHRDVKPENILITTEGQVKVADFGLSRAFAASQATSGKLYGTAHYLAPEQVRGDAVDHRADVYALGVVLYEMLTGRTPFEGDSPAAIAYRRVHEDVPSAMGTNPSVPRELDSIVLRATAREPDGRFPTAGAMADALRGTGARAEDVGLLVHHTTAVPVDGEPTIAISRRTRTARKRRRRAFLIVAAVLAVIASSTLIAGRLSRFPVPGVVGATQEEAKSRLEAKGLRVDVVLRNDNDVLSGRVISQDPPPDAGVRTGSTVHVVISLGPEMISPPDVINMPFVDAEAALREAGFQVRRVDTFSDKVPRLQVISQDIADGVLVEAGSIVTLKVSKGPELRAVPDVIGDPERTARADLERLGFKVTIKREQNAKIAKGLVISQTPDGGTDARKGSAVGLVVSKGPPLVNVPNLRCMTREQANDALAHAGLRGRFEGSGGRVVDQAPVPGAKAPKGSRVTAYMGYGSFC